MEEEINTYNLTNEWDLSICDSNEYAELFCSGVSIAVKLFRKVLSSVLYFSSHIIQFLLLLLVKVITLIPTPPKALWYIFELILYLIISFPIIYILWISLSYAYTKILDKLKNPVTNRHRPEIDLASRSRLRRDD